MDLFRREYEVNGIIRVAGFKPIILKEVEEKAGEDDLFETVGLMSTASMDRQGDKVRQDALLACTQRFVRDSGILCYNHDWDAGIGRVTQAWGVKVATDHGDVDGTMIRCRLGRGFSVPFSGVLWPVDDIRSQIRQRILRSHSYAFDAEAQGKGEDRWLVPSEVFESSFVTVPANVEAHLVSKMFKALQIAVPPAEVDERLEKEVERIRRTLDKLMG
jgi:hypothetical protein